MKRLILLTATALLFNGILNAQGPADALRFSQYQYEGTAKSMAMGNAVTSLGGDIYSISINPAASAVYRYSEFSFTPSFNIINNSASYIDMDTKTNTMKANLASIGYVGVKNYGNRNTVRNVNFGVAYNVLNNYNNSYKVRGRTAESSWLGALAWQTGGYLNSDLNVGDTWNAFYHSDAPWRSILAWNTNLINPLDDLNYLGSTENDDGQNIFIGGPLNQTFVRTTTGILSEILFNGGINILDKLYLGASLSVQTLTYNDTQRYSEQAENSSQFNSGFSDFTNQYIQNTTGTGFNLKFGAIVTPVAGFRIAASISTPTWMYMKLGWDESIRASFNDGYSSYLETPHGYYEYRINTPFRWNLGASYVLGNIGVISADYESVNYGNILMKDENGDEYEFRQDNQTIKRYFQNSSIYRVGAEIRPVKGLALRAGYSFYTNPDVDFDYDISYASAGLGFSSGGFFADLGVQKLLNNSEQFTLYNDYDVITAPTGTLKYSTLKVLLTIGFRF